MTSVAEPRAPATELQSFAEKCLLAYGVPEAHARITADLLVQTDLLGIDSHGIAHLDMYVDGLHEGRVNPKPTIRVVQGLGASTTMDGDNGLGFVGGAEGMAYAIARARELGAGFVSMRNSNHFGAAAVYARMALAQDMIGVASTVGGILVVPPGGAQRTIGANPVAIAIPTAKEPPFLMDISSCVVAFGKIELALRYERPIPLGWALDKSLQPTTDPKAVADGGLILPLGGARETGGHKGYGLALVLATLCGVLSGAGWGFPRPDGRPRDTGHFFGAFRIDAFRPIDEFKADMDAMLRQMKDSPKAPGVERIYTPGEPEREIEADRKVNGVPLHPKVIAKLRELGEQCGVTFPV